MVELSISFWGPTACATLQDTKVVHMAVPAVDQLMTAA